MGDGLKCPEMKWGTGDDQLALQEYRTRLERWFTIKGTTKESQHHYIIFQAGDHGEELSKTWGISDENAKDPKNVWDKFQQSVGLADNFRVHRMNLTLYKQKETETIDEFYTRCRALALKCKFVDFEERLIDQIIVGARSAESQRELLKEDEKLTIDNALQKCRMHEASDAHMKAFEQAGAMSTTTIGAVSKNPKGKKYEIVDCKFCAKNHTYGDCPAYYGKCSQCGKTGHWKVRCPQLQQRDVKRRPHRRRNKPRHSKGPTNKSAILQTDSVEENFERLAFDSIHTEPHGDSVGDIMVHIEARIPERTVPADMLCKIDTGAQGNVLPLRTFKKMYPEHADTPGNCTLLQKRPYVKLNAYNGTDILQHGIIKFMLRHKSTEKQWKEAEFYVAETPGPIIVGKNTSVQLGVITVNCISEMTWKITETNSPSVAQKPIHNTEELVNLYPDRFTGIGKFKDKYHIDLRPNVKPVVHPPRKYPIHLKEEIHTELNNMVDLGVIEPIPENESTEWLNSLAFSRKSSGKLRVCLDPRDLNAAIKRTYHRTPTTDEIVHQLNGASLFSKLDAKHGYWSIELDKESSALTSFCAPGGRYRFKRLPFGVRVAQDVFQGNMDRILAACPGTMNITDDIIVYGRNADEHDRNLHRLMTHARECGLVFSSQKCAIRVPEVEFFGSIYTADGVRPDPKKSEEIFNLPSPTSVKELQQFLGMVQYMSPFIANLSEKTGPLRELTKKDSSWMWTATHETTFRSIKEEICNAITLSYFNPRLDTKIQVDASTRGLGAALVQVENGHEKVIAFASKALTPVEQRYANIEREMLAVVFGAERFHTFVYGSPFTIESDHKPLEQIHLKNISQAPPRLQRMLLRIQPYELHIKYRPGKELLLADALSRLNPKPSETIQLDKTIHSVKWSQDKLQELRFHTQQDNELGPLCQVVTNGWPEYVHDLPKCVRNYWSVKDSITVEDGLLMKGVRVIIPKHLQRDILNRLHTSHLGIEKTRLRARTCVYWKGIDKDIEDIINSCDICLEVSRSEQKQSLIPHDLPSAPWQKLGTDLFEVDGQHYIIVADYYSKMPFIRKINSESSKEVINKLKGIFSEHGIPDILYSDGGPCYSSREFASFAQKWDFCHRMSSPHYPQSNGFVERTIGTVKKVLRKAISSGTDQDLALLCVRSTPIDPKIGSPSDLLYGRTIKANLPIYIKGDENVLDQLKAKQMKQKLYYDRTAKDRPHMQIGQRVGLQDPASLKWTTEKIVEKCNEPRSYIVEKDTGSRLRRNQRFLKDLSTQTTSTLIQSESNDTLCGDVNNICAEGQDKTMPSRTWKYACAQDDSQSSIKERPSRTRKAPERLIETM